MAARSRSFGKGAKEAQPLRSNNASATYTPEQERLIAALLAGAVIGDLGVYAKRNERSGMLSVKFYEGDESYADMLYPVEVTMENFDDFAKKLGFQPHFRALAVAK